MSSRFFQLDQSIDTSSPLLRLVRQRHLRRQRRLPRQWEPCAIHIIHATSEAKNAFIYSLTLFLNIFSPYFTPVQHPEIPEIAAAWEQGGAGTILRPEAASPPKKAEAKPKDEPQTSAKGAPVGTVETA